MESTDFEFKFMPKSIGSKFHFAFRYAYEVTYFIHAEKNGRTMILTRDSLMPRDEVLSKRDILLHLQELHEATKEIIFPEYDSTRLDEELYVIAMDSHIKEE